MIRLIQGPNQRCSLDFFAVCSPRINYKWAIELVWLNALHAGHHLHIAIIYACGRKGVDGDLQLFTMF